MTTHTIELKARIKHPVAIFPEAMRALQALGKVAHNSAVPLPTLLLVELRASQINGCSVCADIHSREMQHLGMSTEQMHTIAAWREAPYFSDAERAALALAEAATRLADRPDPVPDAIWNEAARHYSEQELAGLVLAIGVINAY
ncbi:MAG TPA: carboxymuconolactone decarboxylase family protein, partial [Candidatus Cybelea sp.]